MSSFLYKNAVSARLDRDAASRSIVVAGDEGQAALWRRRLAARPGDLAGMSHDLPLVLAERGRKGNLLGTLQAYKRALLDPDPLGDRSVEQIVMLLGSGSRLSPITQALGNVKAAFPLPDADASPIGTTIGEAAIRASSPWVACLRAGGFDGLVMRWGDEVLIPGSDLAVRPGQFADIDVVRFGWPAVPTHLLATQKEWLLVDPATGLVTRDISRQSLESLEAELRWAKESKIFVNLGSFAASHRFLETACEIFGDYLDASSVGANWDPYFWMALQCYDAESWQATKQKEATSGRTGIEDLEERFPEFFATVQALKSRFAQRIGRPVRVGVLDFGEPYWLDAGNHVALRKAFEDVFASGTHGKTIRAFLGLPESVAEGESFIQGSDLVPGIRIHNSVVIGSEISDPESKLDRAIVVGSRLGSLRMTPGAVAISCVGRELRVDGPRGVAFRHQGGNVSGHESVVTLRAGDESLVFRYDDLSGVIDNGMFGKTLFDNPMSFRDAADLMSSIDPVWLDDYWYDLRFDRSAR